jgi:hypothetical protein
MANEKWLTHFEGVGINVLNHETKILVNAALVNQLKVFTTLFQQRNDRINDCHVFSEDNTIINICENNAVLLKEDTFINLTLDKVTSDKPFTELLEPVVASLLEAIKALVQFENVSAPVPIRDINWINSCRKLHVNRYIQMCLRECKNKVNAFLI